MSKDTFNGFIPSEGWANLINYVSSYPKAEERKDKLELILECLPTKLYLLSQNYIELLSSDEFSKGEIIDILRSSFFGYYYGWKSRRSIYRNLKIALNIIVRNFGGK